MPRGTQAKLRWLPLKRQPAETPQRAAAAVANARYNATGKRIRDLPITPDKLL
jgi:hypothetical protein